MAIPTKKTEIKKTFLDKTMLIYGPPKVGKSSFVAGLSDDDNKILFFTTEPGHNFLEIYKWQKEIKDKDGNITSLEDPTTWEDFKMCVLEVTKQSDFKCLAIDVTDILFHWCSKSVNKKNKIEHESDLGFGKGYSLIRDEFLSAINYLTQKGYGVIFISHSSTQDKELINKKITYTDSTLAATAKKIIHGLCDYILYAHVDVDGNRILKTKGTETINAGDRSGRLPESLELDANKFRELLKQ